MTAAKASNTLSSHIPSTHVRVGRQIVTVDGENAELTRFERRDWRSGGLNGEHFSTVMGSQGKLKGFANMTLDLVGKPLVSRNSLTKATGFVNGSAVAAAAPDWLEHRRRSG